MPSRTAAVLGQMIRTAVNGGLAGLSDRELLHRFADTGDQTAFAALFRRHSGMVLGVCQRALSNVQDAEDACQATFLLLAQKARSGRWQPSLSNWLYTTARRVARNARLAAQRRRRREARAALPEAVQPVDEMTGRELLALLDEELDRLPLHYREPLLLCHLQGLTRDEAAQRLGVPLATLKSHLERGRKRLGSALTKRGCVLGAGLLAVAVTSPAGASPPRLLQAVLAAAAGSPSTSVAALVKGVAVNGIMRKLWIVVLALLGTGVLGTGMWSLLSVPASPPVEKALPSKAEKPDPKAEPSKEADAKVTLSGRVLDPEGKPFAGAKLFVPFLKKMPPATEENIGVKQVGTTDEDGRFSVALAPLPFGRLSLIAYAPGFGVGGLNLDVPQKAIPLGDQTLRLVKDVPISGRVVNPAGQPISGVVVQVLVIYVPTDEKLDDYLAGLKRDFMGNLTNPRKQMLMLLQPSTGSATTDKDGRFILRGAGTDAHRSAPHNRKRRGQVGVLCHYPTRF